MTENGVVRIGLLLALQSERNGHLKTRYQKEEDARQWIVAGCGVVALAVVAFFVTRLKPAAPEVDRATVWTDAVKRGPLLRQVRGPGTLVAREDKIRVIPAETEATISRIRVLPGSQVKADTIIMDMVDPTVDQQMMDATLALKGAKADLENTRATVNSNMMVLRAESATLDDDTRQALLQAKTDKSLYDLGVVSGLTSSASGGKADEMGKRQQIEQQKLEMNQRAIATMIGVQEAKVQQAEAVLALKQRQKDALTVRAGIDGVLEAPDVPLQVGQHVDPGTMLAKVVQPDQLKAALKIAETQARDIQIGQPAEVDTHNGVIEGKVMRIDLAVVNGTVTVDVELSGAMPLGARPDLSVDGTIDLDRMTDVLYVGRPAFGNENSTISLFKLGPDGKTAVRVPVKVGRASVNSIQVLEGLQEGDTVILSDMSRWDNTDQDSLELAHRLRKGRVTMTTTETIIQIEDLTKIFYTDEIETHALVGRAFEYQPRRVCGDVGAVGMRKVDAVVDHRIAGYSDRRALHVERQGGGEPELCGSFADSQSGDRVHLSELQPDWRPDGRRERGVAADVSRGDAVGGAKAESAGVARTSEYGAPDAALSGAALGRSAAEGRGGASAGRFAVDSAGGRADGKPGFEER